MQHIIAALFTLIFPIVGQFIGRYILQNWDNLWTLILSIPPFNIIPAFLFYNNINKFDIQFNKLIPQLLFILIISIIILCGFSIYILSTLSNKLNINNSITQEDNVDTISNEKILGGDKPKLNTYTNKLFIKI